MCWRIFQYCLEPQTNLQKLLVRLCFFLEWSFHWLVVGFFSPHVRPKDDLVDPKDFWNILAKSLANLLLIWDFLCSISQAASNTFMILVCFWLINACAIDNFTVILNFFTLLRSGVLTCSQSLNIPWLVGCSNRSSLLFSVILSSPMTSLLTLLSASVGGGNMLSRLMIVRALS